MAELLYFFSDKQEFFSSKKTPKTPDPSYKTDLDFWD